MESSSGKKWGGENAEAVTGCFLAVPVAVKNGRLAPPH